MIDLNQKLATRFEHLQIERVLRSEVIADLLGNEVDRTVDQVLQITQRKRDSITRSADIAEALKKLPEKLIEIFEKSTSLLGLWSYKEAGKVLAKTLPRVYFRKIQPSSVLVGEDQTPDEVFQYDDEFGPISGRRLTDPEWEEWVSRNVFAPPPPSKVREILERPTLGVTYQKRIENLSRLVDPEKVAGELVDGFAAGKNVDQLTKQILPQVTGNVRSSARRIARTESLRVANEMQRESYEDLGDLMIGTQILATLDQNTRPHHALRNGRIHYRDGRQPGEDTLPVLPDEPNCRCFDIPVMSPPEELEDDPELAAEFRNASREAIPDPQEYSHWFQSADEGRRKIAVGAQRYNLVKQRLGNFREPEWTDFIDGEGKLLPTKQISRETEKDALLRKGLLSRKIEARKQMIQQISATGFEDPGLRRTKRVLKLEDPNQEISHPVTQERIERVRQVMGANKKQAKELRKKVIEAGRLKASEKKFNRPRYQKLAERVSILDAKRANGGALTASEKKELDAKWIRLKAEVLEARRERELQRERVLPLLRVKDPIRIEGDPAKKALPGVRSSWKEGRNFVESVTSRKHAANGRHGDGKGKLFLSIAQLPEKKGLRSFYSVRRKILMIAEGSSPSVVAHELGHALEEFGETHELVSGFLQSRTQGEALQILNDALGTDRYEDWELGREDKFARAFLGRLLGLNKEQAKGRAFYTGKRYEGASEVLSMGLELLYDDPVGFAQRDPEFFDFVVGLLRGDLLP